MTDLILQIGLSNACLSLALAVVAVVVGATVRRPGLTNLLWLLVLVKLVTPPVVSIPVATLPVQDQTAAVTADTSRTPSPSADPSTDRPGRSVFGSGVSAAGVREPDASRSERTVAGRGADLVEQPPVSLIADIKAAAWEVGKKWGPPLWLLGSVCVLVGSLTRACRFSRLLAAESEAAPPQLQAVAREVADRLGLGGLPAIRTTSARLSPMVWWAGGRVCVVIPTMLLETLAARQVRWVLAHELAHVRRRDHLVRWLEWLACVGFWWNPVVWWARRNLRATEEICCDALVLSALKPQPHSYATSLLTAVESLACPAIRRPAMASEINGGGFLERRFRMIVSKKASRANSRWMQAVALLCATAVLPLGLAVAQDLEAVERRLGQGVAEGELTLKQAAAMMDALREAAGDERAHREKAHERDGKALERMKHWVDSVGARIKEAVEKGQLSEEDAWKKWHAFKEREFGPKLKHAVEAGHMSEADAKALWRGVEIAEAGERLKAAVARGDLTEEQARAKWAQITRKAPGNDRREEADERDRRATERFGHWVESVSDKLDAAVENGDLSEEEAWAKWYAFKEKEFGPKLKGAVEAGHMSEHAARALWLSVEKAEAAERIKAAVAKGEMTEEQARAKWAQINRDFEAKGKQHDRRGERERIDAHLKAVWAKLQAAVKAGKMSEEDAHRKMGEIKKEIFAKLKGRAHREDPRIEKYRRIEAEIRAAVEAGKLSREEAGRKLEAIRREMFRDRSRPARDDRGEDHDQGAAAERDQIVRRIGAALVRAASGIRKPQVTIDADPARAVAVEVPEQDGGIMLVPQRGISEDKEPDMTVRNGTPLGMLFASAPLVPVIDGKPVDRSKLYNVTFTDAEGRAHPVNCLLLSVKQLSEDDYRLYAFGKAGKPLIDVRITDGDGPDTMPLALEVKETDDGPADVVITIYGKYQARFPGGVAE